MGLPQYERCQSKAQTLLKHPVYKDQHFNLIIIRITNSKKKDKIKQKKVFQLGRARIVKSQIINRNSMETKIQQGQKMEL